MCVSGEYNKGDRASWAKYKAQLATLLAMGVPNPGFWI